MPWYREPMLWLVIALPAAAVVAGLSTLAIAIAAGGGDSVPDSVRRTAQMQTADLAADTAAGRLGISAELVRSADTGAIAVELRGAAQQPLPARLELRLSHPTEAAADRELQLVQAGGRWLGRLDADGSRNDWRLQLSPEDGAWRLRGRLAAHATRTQLLPELIPR